MLGFAGVTPNVARDRVTVERMRADAAKTPGSWIDPRPTYIIVAAKPAS